MKKILFFILTQNNMIIKLQKNKNKKEEEIFLTDQEIESFLYLKSLISFNKNKSENEQTNEIYLEENHFNAIKFIIQEKTDQNNTIPNKFLDSLEFLQYTFFEEYPKSYNPEYVKIYETEKKLRNPKDKENLIDITNFIYQKKLNPNALKIEPKGLKKVPYFNGEYNGEYRKILYNLLEIFKKYSKDIVIAGGFVLGYFLEIKFGITFDICDIDIFFICSIEKAKEIIKNILMEGMRNQQYNLNGQLIFADRILVDENENQITVYYNMENFQFHSLQFIKRIYKSKSEIIHGFDVDCCCMLLELDINENEEINNTNNINSKIYCTQRCFYSLKTGTNYFNFEKMSSSYEYRLYKYGLRGFNIFIPNFDLFKKRITTDENNLENTGSDILIRKILFGSYGFISDYKFYKNTKYIYKNDIYIIKELFRNMKFKSLNPEEQISGTFHKTILEDNKLWYGTKNLSNPFNFMENESDFKLEKLLEDMSNKNIIEIDHKFKQKKIENNFVYYKKIKNYKENPIITDDFNNFLNFIPYDLDNKGLYNFKCKNLYISGDFARILLTNSNGKRKIILKIFFENEKDKENDFNLYNFFINICDYYKTFNFIKWIVTQRLSSYYKCEKFCIEKLNTIVNSISIQFYDFIRNENISFFPAINEYIKENLNWENFNLDYYEDEDKNEDKKQFEYYDIHFVFVKNNNLYKEIHRFSENYVDEEKNINYNILIDLHDFRNCLPKFRIYNKKYENKFEMINEEFFDFNKVIYNIQERKFYSTELGIYALKNMVHFSSNCNIDNEQNFENMNKEVIYYGNKGYGFYDPNRHKKIRRVKDY